jgi:hypothetical protein
MRMNNIDLRVYSFIDSLQPQLASYLATSSQGFLPVPGDAIRAITPDHATLINRQLRKGSMLLPGKSMFILETEPAGYIVQAANEAEKAAHVTLIDVRAFGNFGRLTMMGSEAETEEAMRAAEATIASINARARRAEGF